MKTWLLEVGLKTFGPSAVRGAVLGLSGWFIMKNDMLAQFGIVSDSVQRITTIHWDQLSIAVVAVIPAVIAGIVKTVQHEGEKTVQKVIKPKEGEQK